MATRLPNRQPYLTVLETGERDQTIVMRTINNAIAGNLNVVGEMELKSGTTETRIHDPRISYQSFFVFQFLSAPPAGGYGFWLKERGVRTALIGHTAPGADVWIEYMVIG